MDKKLNYSLEYGQKCKIVKFQRMSGYNGYIVKMESGEDAWCYEEMLIPMGNGESFSNGQLWGMVESERLPKGAILECVQDRTIHMYFTGTSFQSYGSRYGDMKKGQSWNLIDVA